MSCRSFCPWPLPRAAAPGAAWLTRWFCQWASAENVEQHWQKRNRNRSCEQPPFSSVHDWGSQLLKRDNCNPLLKYVEIAIYTSSLQPDFSGDIVSRGGWKHHGFKWLDSRVLLGYIIRLNALNHWSFWITVHVRSSFPSVILLFCLILIHSHPYWWYLVVGNSPHPHTLLTEFPAVTAFVSPYLVLKWT
jgi:hypothetical protein